MEMTAEQNLEYVFKVFNEELADQKALLKDEQDESGRAEIESRIEQLKRGIKIVKEYLKGQALA